MLDDRREALNAEIADLSPADPRPLPPSGEPGNGQPPATPGFTQRRSGVQRAAGLLIAVACVGAGAWYVPHVLDNDSRLLTGTVASSGVIGLNFARSGYLASVPVHVGETVHKGQMLAAEYAPAADARLNADKAVIAADQARMAELKATPDANQPTELIAARAQLAKDQAHLASDRASADADRIVAPSSGTVLAVNGQPGETVSANGIRTGPATAQPSRGSQQPLFSLTPQGPQSGHGPGSSPASLPVVTLRTSTTWHVAALVPEDGVSRVQAGQRVTISVPAAHISRVRGRIEEILPTPASTTDGNTYEALVTVTGHAAGTPLDGMAADVTMSS